MVVFGEKWFYSCKVDVFGQSGCIRAKVVIIEEKWLYSKKSGFILAKVLELSQSVCIRAKKVVFGKSSCISAKVVVIRKKWLYSGKVVVFG